MNETYAILLPILIPIIIGLFILIMKEPKKRSTLILLTSFGLFGGVISVIWVILGDIQALTLWHLTPDLPIYFAIDEISILFASIVSIVWILSGIFAFAYMKHEHKNKRYFGFYLIVYGILIALDFSGNIVTFYVFYELMTILSAPLVFHTQSRESIMAGLKYLFYSFCGAYLVLFGIYFVYQQGLTLDFVAGGVFAGDTLFQHSGLLLFASGLMILGFSVKAGMLPLHAWLWAAHPVAPAPASAALSGIIVKGGVLGIIRVVFYLFGADFLSGSWVQTTWLILSLLTVFMGSMLAYREKILKKRLAYSTISQISYILFGLALLNPISFTGSILHVIFHAIIKCGLFLCAGAMIFATGKTQVADFKGIGKKMPITLWCYTFLSMALIGIPPTSGFISKWFLATGSLNSDYPVFAWFGPIILLVSALLTAGYLLPLTIQGFFSKAEGAAEETQETNTTKWETNPLMLIPLILLALLSLGLGLFPNQLIEFINLLCAGIL